MSSVSLMGFLSLSFPVSGIYVLSLYSHKIKGSGSAIITLRYFILEVVQESLIELMMKGSINPVAVRS
jgi:hypothetical protein